MSDPRWRTASGILLRPVYAPDDLPQALVWERQRRSHTCA
jgi:hypothetical protein